MSFFQSHLRQIYILKDEVSNVSNCNSPFVLVEASYERQKIGDDSFGSIRKLDTRTKFAHTSDDADVNGVVTTAQAKAEMNP